MRCKKEGRRFTRVNACHLADAQSDLLLFLRNPTRFPIWDEKLVPSTTHQDSPFNPLYRGENRIPNSLSLLPLTIPLCVRIFAVSNQRRRLKKLSLLLLKSNDESFQISYQDLELPGVNYSRVWKFCDTWKYSHRIGNLLRWIKIAKRTLYLIHVHRSRKQKIDFSKKSHFFARRNRRERVNSEAALPRLPLLATQQRSYRRAGPYLTLFSSSGFASPGRRPLFRNACTAARPQPVPACSFCPLRALWPQQRRGRSSRGRQEIMVRFPSRNGLSWKKKDSGRDETSLFRIFRDEIFLERWS